MTREHDILFENKQIKSGFTHRGRGESKLERRKQEEENGSESEVSLRWNRRPNLICSFTEKKFGRNARSPAAERRERAWEGRK